MAPVKENKKDETSAEINEIENTGTMKETIKPKVGSLRKKREWLNCNIFTY